jgi:hypothetical protein
MRIATHATSAPTAAAQFTASLPRLREHLHLARGRPPTEATGFVSHSVPQPDASVPETLSTPVEI